MKLLLYCTKGKPYLLDLKKDIFEAISIMLNGKIIGECDYEVEEIKLDECNDFKTDTLQEKELCERSGLDVVHLNFYLDLWAYQEKKEVYGYAIHIKNLHVFDEPKELSDYYHNASKLEKAPQNMMRVQELIKSSYKGAYLIKDYVLISVRPEWLCKILNGEKTIEVRKKVLKEMKR